MSCDCVQLDKMESALNKELTQLQAWQQRKPQLEEKVHKARLELRDMKNTLEKYTATIQVSQPSSPTAHQRERCPLLTSRVPFRA